MKQTDAEAAAEYNRKWDERVAQGNEAMQIVLRHRRQNIPLDPQAYPQGMWLDIKAAMLRLQYRENWDAGRLIDDNGDEDGNPTRERKAPLGTRM